MPKLKLLPEANKHGQAPALYEARSIKVLVN